MKTADFLTVDVYERPAGGRIRWSRAVKTALKGGIDGLRAASVNYANNGTHSLAPRIVPGGGALVAAWDSAEAAVAAFRGPLREALSGPDRFSLDGEVVRVRFNNEGDHWHGWTPVADGAEPLAADEPMVAVVHGIVRPQQLTTFVRNNMHAASRAAHHPGHRGSALARPIPAAHILVADLLAVALDHDHPPHSEPMRNKPKGPYCYVEEWDQQKHQKPVGPPVSSA
jgi:hypothetical protein